MDIQDSIHVCGTPNIPGVRTRVFLVCECDVETWPDRLATTAPGDAITLDGDIVLKTGKFWSRFDIISQTGEIKNTMIGVRGSKSYQQTFDFQKANITDEVDDWFNTHANMCAIAVVEDNMGIKRVMGKPGCPVDIATAEGTSGMGPDSGRIWTSQLYAHTGEVALTYTGELPIAP